MELLDIQIDLYHLKQLLCMQDSVPHELVCNRIVYYIGKYKNSPAVTEQQMEIIQEYVDNCFSLMIVHKPEEFLNEILQTNAAMDIRMRGLDALLDKCFAKLSALDKVYLLYLEFYSGFLEQDGNLADLVNRVRSLTDKIRYADKVFADKIPYSQQLIHVFEMLYEGNFKLEGIRKSNVLSGCGYLELTVICQSENNRKLLSDMHIACKPIVEGLAFPSKMGVYDNLAVDIKEENRKYMEEHEIPFVMNEKSYLIDSTQRNTLMLLTYRDLIKLWPDVRYFIVSKYMMEEEDEKTFCDRIDYCRALDGELHFSPFPPPVIPAGFTKGA